MPTPAPSPDVLASFLQMLGPILQQQAQNQKGQLQLQTDQAFGRHLGMYGGAVDPATGMDVNSPWANGMFSPDHGRAAAIQKEQSIFGKSQTAGEIDPAMVMAARQHMMSQGTYTPPGTEIGRETSPEFVGPNPQWLQMPGAPTEYQLNPKGGLGDSNMGQMTGSFTPGIMRDAFGHAMMSPAPAFRGPRLRY